MFRRLKKEDIKTKKELYSDWTKGIKEACEIVYEPKI